MSDTPDPETCRVLSLTVPAALAARLEALAARESRPLEAVLHQALTEFAAHWEDYYTMTATVDSGTEPRLRLDAVRD